MCVAVSSTLPGTSATAVCQGSNSWRPATHSAAQHVRENKQLGYRIVRGKFWLCVQFLFQALQTYFRACMSGHESSLVSAEPDEQAPPSAMPTSSTSVLLTWFEPEAPNGFILNYTVYRDAAPVSTVTALTYTDTNLTPNTQYRYSIEATNSVGSTQSVEIVTRTLEGVPEGIDPPTLTALSAISVRAMWVGPAMPNGVVTRYEVVMVTLGPEQVVVAETSVANTTGDVLSAIVSELAPFTIYDFLIRACTSGGCGSSEASEVQTLQAPPTFQPTPNVTTVSSQELLLNWVVPPMPNGVVSNYEVFLREFPFTGVGVSLVNTSQLSFLVGGLRPFVRYEFSVATFTAGGGVVSDWVAGTTDEEGE